MDFLVKMVATKRYVFVFLALITLLVYFPVMRGGFVFDDDIYIVNNNLVHDLSHVKQIYSQDATSGAGDVNGNVYRPNQSLVHAIIFTVFGKGATAHHLFSIVVHLLNVCLLFFLLTLLGFYNISAFFAAALFAVHPIHTEAVAYISNLCDPLSMLFILCSSIFYVYYRNSGHLYFAVFTIATVLLALFTKESSSMLFLLLLLLEIYLQPKIIKIKKQQLILLVFTLILGACFVFLKYSMLNSTEGYWQTAGANAYTGSIVVRFITFCTILPRYFGMLLFPVNQFVEKPYIIYVSMEALGFGGLMLLGAMVYMFYFSLKASRAVMLAIGVFFAFLLPVSGIFPVGAIYLEHWLYLPFLGVAVGIAFLVQNNMAKYKSLVLTIFVVLLLGYSSKSMYRNNQWAEPVRFYKNEIKFNKKSARVYSSLAMELHRRNDFFSAINYYSMAISVDDAYPQTHHYLAVTYLQLNQVSNAIAEEYKALEMQPGYGYSLQSLLDIYTKLKDEKRVANFSKYLQEVTAGKEPSWNEIKENLHADN